MAGKLRHLGSHCQATRAALIQINVAVQQCRIIEDRQKRIRRDGVMYPSDQVLKIIPYAVEPRPSHREHEVLALLAAGYPMKQIAYELGITYRTVTFHKYRLMGRLGIRTNAGLVHYALRNGVLAENAGEPNLAAA